MSKSCVNKKRKGVKNLFLSIPYLVWSLLFIIVPIFIVAYFAYTDGNGNFTLANLAELP